MVLCGADLTAALRQENVAEKADASSLHNPRLEVIVLLPETTGLSLPLWSLFLHLSLFSLSLALGTLRWSLSRPLSQGLGHSSEPSDSEDQPSLESIYHRSRHARWMWLPLSLSHRP